jgi:hypothetical protein
MGRYKGRIVPLGFALMKRKRRASYRAVFAALADRYLVLTGQVLAPRLIITDYEVGYRNYSIKNFVGFVKN